MRITRFVSAAAIAALPPGAAAAPLSYDTIELGYVDSELENGTSVDGDGLRADGSMALEGAAPGLFGFGTLESIGYDGGLDADTLVGGLGLSTRLGPDPAVDLYGGGSIQYLDLGGAGGAGDQELGFGIRGGLRAALDPRLELGAELSFADYGNLDSTFITLGGAYDLNEQVAVTLRYRNGEYEAGGSTDREDLQLGVRIYY